MALFFRLRRDKKRIRDLRGRTGARHTVRHQAEPELQLPVLLYLGAPGAAPGSPAEEPTNNFFPSVNVRTLPLARFVPSFA